MNERRRKVITVFNMLCHKYDNAKPSKNLERYRKQINLHGCNVTEGRKGNIHDGTVQNTPSNYRVSGMLSSHPSINTTVVLGRYSLILY